MKEWEEREWVVRREEARQAPGRYSTVLSFITLFGRSDLTGALERVWLVERRLFLLGRFSMPGWGNIRRATGLLRTGVTLLGRRRWYRTRYFQTAARQSRRPFCAFDAFRSLQIEPGMIFSKLRILLHQYPFDNLSSLVSPIIAQLAWLQHARMRMYVVPLFACTHGLGPEWLTLQVLGATDKEAKPIPIGSGTAQEGDDPPLGSCRWLPTVGRGQTSIQQPCWNDGPGRGGFRVGRRQAWIICQTA